MANGLMDMGMGGAFPQMMGAADMSGAGVRQFMPIADDADFFKRMQSGEFDDWDNLDEGARAGVMDYINRPASALTGQQIGAAGMGQANQLGMSAAKDMSQFAQAEPLQGLMGMATQGVQRPQKQPFNMQGLMNPWGG